MAQHSQFQTVAIPKRLQLVGDLQSSDGTFDRGSKLINCFAEKDPSDGEYWVQKRPGFSAPLLLLSSTGVTAGRGLYKFVKSTSVFQFLSVNGGRLNAIDSSVLGSTIIGTVGGIGSQVQYVFETINSTPSFLAVLNDGANAYYTDGVTVTSMNALPNFPTAIVKGWAYLDGTLYVMDRNRNIYGSQNLDDPTVWDPLNVIVARKGPGAAIALAKHKEYVVALKTTSTEFFYDNANPAGSPLSSLPGTALTHGCLSADTVQDIDGDLFWVTNSLLGQYQVIRLVNLQPRIISTPDVERLLRGYDGTFDTIISLGLKACGHRFYCVSFCTVGRKLMTLVYDLDQGLWYKWMDAAGTSPFPLTSQAGTDILGRLIVQNFVINTVHELGEDYLYPTDNGGLPAQVDIYTVDQDFGTQRNKNLSRMFFRGDRVTGSTLQLRWSDDDSTTWSNFRQFDYGSLRPSLTDCGSFSRRTWDLRHEVATSFRIKTTDLQLDIGTG